ncbi:MAG: hypothetical protein DMG73_09620 [Acidobacteria bacterium]|nr:MAG: hypothetical protein DMG73_09620 [Acidobacteriota bacterium]PYX64267.1 MAG: hypothetical protein DMG74_13645 [Acidobacteriota bacterium]
MRKTPLPLIIVLSLIVRPWPSVAQQGRYLYKATLVQAAPGKILEVIDLFQTISNEMKQAGTQAPLWMRHSQGDRWDLLLLFPMGSYGDYYGREKVGRRDTNEPLSVPAQKLKQDVSWQEDVFVYGPPLQELRKAFDAAGFFHVEMFQSLPGKQAELYRERDQENLYSRALKQPENLIFVRDQGAAWDLFTIGCFRDLKHYAEAADVSQKDQDAAAKAAGFESASQIGPYLRTLISLHHDTLAVAVK